MQSVGVKEYRAGVTHGWDFKVVFRKLTYFDYYILSFYLKDYIDRIFRLKEFVDIGYLFSHCVINYYIKGSFMIIYFYDGLYEDYYKLYLNLKKEEKKISLRLRVKTTIHRNIKTKVLFIKNVNIITKGFSALKGIGVKTQLIPYVYFDLDFLYYSLDFTRIKLDINKRVIERTKKDYALKRKLLKKLRKNNEFYLKQNIILFKLGDSLKLMLNKKKGVN